MIFREILAALVRIEEGQQEILDRLERLETPHPSPAATPSPQGEGLGVRTDEWVQKGIDSILSYQVGKKKEER